MIKQNFGKLEPGFLEDIEKNLRLIDIDQISFSTGDTSLYDFTVKARAYFQNEE